ncbi:uncharacterized protein LOC130915851 [Corythoichthys intestinalis]|uniref:uncharacterized protein LOC130915851 n=1 Tax=Corythoichthys intestinalis TaxID=161448 RepID=UPI0025A5637E|nr:uncharacterized protein LOC130915851 [Corythoichthys intestinalis]
MPVVNFGIKEVIRERGNQGIVAEEYLGQRYGQSVLVFTDGSKDPETGRTGAAVHVPSYNVDIKTRCTDHLSVYAVEVTAIIMALGWVQTNGIKLAVIASDSWSALTSILTMKSSRLDLVFELHRLMYEAQKGGLRVEFVWVPAHVGIEGNEVVDILAKQSLRALGIERQGVLSRAEGKSIIGGYIQKRWQEYWEAQETGRHFFSIQSQVGVGRRLGRSRREEVVLSRMRIGHTGLNDSLHRIGKHKDGKCKHCGERETVEHILMVCGKYGEQRDRFRMVLHQAEETFGMGNVLQMKRANIQKGLIKFLRDTGLLDRI